jgi:branched-chain amino acid transport system permease protein
VGTFLTLFINGLAEAALLFLLAAGLTIILGMMGVLNFAHGTLFLWGGYVHVWLYAQTGDFILSLAGATATGFLLGLAFERLFIRGFYGRPTAQILITLGLMIVFSELARLLWGPDALVAVRPAALSGTLTFQGAIVARYRLFLILVGAAFAIFLHLVMQKSRIGMVIRAGVQSAEMVQALGIDIRRYFSLVFAAGAAMAALGGALYAPMVGGV